MGKGRPPKPKLLHILEGTDRPDRINNNEPQPNPGIPSRPEWLLPEAKKEWNRIVTTLPEGLITKVDRAYLSAYCQCWARYVQAEKDIDLKGYSYMTDKGYEGTNPAVALSTKMLEKMATYGSKFGLSPSDRTRLKQPESPKADPFEAFLSKKGG